MNVLVITGCCLKENTSANLSHSSYINGMIKLGHNVDLLCVSDKDVDIDEHFKIPEVDNIYEYYGVSLYEKLAGKRKSIESHTNNTSEKSNVNKEKVGVKRRVVKAAKKFIRGLYGIYNPSVVWYYRAKKFKSDTQYDRVVSMAYPPISHRVAGYLIKHKQIHTKKWVQLWEDPWATDLGNKDSFRRSKKAEGKLLNLGEDIVYVTPLTMKRQQEIFPENADKMRWIPLSTYYQSDLKENSFDVNRYGYFGDYNPKIRNLKPFYNAALNKSIYVDICGSPYGYLSSTEKISISPRLPVDELKAHENKVNVIICLFNLGGGQIPGKIYQYAAGNKTILAILDGSDDEKKVIREYYGKYNRFVFCENTVESITEAIDKIERNDLGNVKNEPVYDFSSEKLAKDLLG